MHYLSYVFIFALFLGLTGCGAGSIGEKLMAADTVETNVPALIADYKSSKKLYYNSQQHFADAEQLLIERGMANIDKAIKNWQKNQMQTGVSKAVSYALFLQDWADAKEGYQLIRSVLISKRINDKEANQLNLLHQKAMSIDQAVDQVTPNDINGLTMNEIMPMISLASGLIQLAVKME